MTENPFFSVIIPCYNSAKYIDATLASLAVQTFQDFEVIVIDDGSTDQSLKACHTSFKKHHLKGEIISRPASRVKGVASCRNLGVEMANADWVCFLDSDDIFNANKFSVTAQLIEKYGNSCQAYHHASENFDDVTDELIALNVQQTKEEPIDIKGTLIKTNLIVTSTVTVSKKLFNEIGGFDTNLHGVEDYFMWLRVSTRTTWCYSQQVLTRYRVRKTSLMSGREFKYYVEQNIRLYTVIKVSGEFATNELKVIHEYILKGLMRYYASVSLAGKGKRDFFKGVIHLFRKGEYLTASNLYFGFLSHTVLTKLSNLRKGI